VLIVVRAQPWTDTDAADLVQVCGDCGRQEWMQPERAHGALPAFDGVPQHQLGARGPLVPQHPA
jgi:hypothetical protein